MSVGGSPQNRYQAIAETVSAACENAPERLLRVLTETSFDVPPRSALLPSVCQGILDHIEKDDMEKAAPESPAVSLTVWAFEQIVRKDTSPQNGLLTSGILLAAARWLGPSKALLRLFPHQLRLAGHRDPEPPQSPPGTEPAVASIALVAKNSVRGRTAQSLILTAFRMRSAGHPLPTLHQTLLLRFAADAHPGVRAAVLMHLPRLAAVSPDLAWRLFDMALAHRICSIWHFGEPFLIAQYRSRRSRVGKYLDAAGRHTVFPTPEAWAAALIDALLDGLVSVREWLADLRRFRSGPVMEAAFDTLADRLVADPRGNGVLNAILVLMAVISDSPAVAHRLETLFQELETIGGIDIVFQIAYKWITVFNGMAGGRGDLGWFYDWLGRQARRAPGSTEQLLETLFSRLDASPACYDRWQGDRYFWRLADALISDQNRANARIVCNAVRIGRGGHRHPCTKSSSDSRKGPFSSSPIRPISS